ncbi:hypothetical protein M0805_001176, partial [Coniferiporia weirii]
PPSQAHRQEHQAHPPNVRPSHSPHLSRFVSRTYANKSHSMFNYVTTPEESDHYATELFKLVESGAVKVNFHREYPFTAEGLQQAQRDITGHSTTGKLIVKVSDE